MRPQSTKLKWRWNALSGYVREPSGALTLTLLSCSYHTVSYTALHTDLNPTNSAIRLIPSDVTSRSAAITYVWFSNLSIKVSKKYFLRCRVSNLKKKSLKKIQVCGFSSTVNDQAAQMSAGTSSGSTDKRRSKSILIPMTPLFSSSISAICSSPAAHLNRRAPSGTYRWFTTVVCLNILSCTPLTHFTLKSLPGSYKSTGPVWVQLISPWLMIPGWVLPRVAWCIMYNFHLCIQAQTCA